MQTWEKIRNNPELLERYFVREKVIGAIRSFFKTQDFHEVQTPILVPTPSCEANLEVFQTELRTLKGKKRNGYLIMSPEYSIKKLLAAGIGNCFEITKCFRNEEEVSKLHNPEFTMLEWYRINSDYIRVMEDFEGLFIDIIKKINPNFDLKNWTYQNESYDISLPWTRITIAEAFQKLAHIDTDTLLSEQGLLEIAKDKGYKVSEKTAWEEIFYQIIFNEIEPELKKTGKPYFLYDYPVSQASLSKKKESDPRFAERFEVFVASTELGNCFSELLDAKEQKTRFEKDLAERKRNGKTMYSVDEELIKALNSGMPEVSGIAVGVDRLVMLAGNFETLSDTLFFPANEIFDLEDT